MSEQTVETAEGSRISRATWIIAIALALVLMWLIYSATQTSTVSSDASSLPGMSDIAPTSMPQSMPGMNH